MQNLEQIRAARALADQSKTTKRDVTKLPALIVNNGLLAATALHHNLTFVTRNTKDIAATGVPAFNPWIT